MNYSVIKIQVQCNKCRFIFHFVQKICSSWMGYFIKYLKKSIDGISIAIFLLVEPEMFAFTLFLSNFEYEGVSLCVCVCLCLCG